MFGGQAPPAWHIRDASPNGARYPSTAQIATVLLDHVERVEVFADDDEEAMLVIPAPTER